MRQVIQVAQRTFRRMLGLYPAPFRAAFAEEMDQVFAQACSDAARQGDGALMRLLIPEMGSWPRAAAREWAAGLRARIDTGGGMITRKEPGSVIVAPGPPPEDNPMPWTHVLLAALALIVPAFGLAGIPGLGWPNSTLDLGVYVLILVGLLVGWLKRFPRWSLPYLGYGVLFAVWLSQVSTPGLMLLGHSFLNQPWGLRAWLGLGAVALAALILTRSLRPLLDLLTGIWRDWTRLSFALYGTLPLVLWILYDEVHDPYRRIFFLASTALAAAGALLHMRSSTASRRFVSLLAGLATAWVLTTGALSAYWHGPRVPGHTPFLWWKTAVPMSIAMVVVAAALAAPGIVGQLRRAAGRQRSGPGRAG